MDGVNNAVAPRHAMPEQYVKEITMAHDGIVNQAAVLAYARKSFDMIRELEAWGGKFQTTVAGDYDLKKVHCKGSYVLPMPEGYDIKKILTRTIRRGCENRKPRDGDARIARCRARRCADAGDAR
jgi:succinate dehydrogenase/fumarate reductase flavoprotein subunit